MRESNKIPTILVGQRERKRFLLLWPKHFANAALFKSAQNAQDQMTQDSLTLAALGFQHRSTA
ncbi:hypothetical protein VC77_12820 [Vibrio cholerae]|nr:hypothetical protein VC77_12820 [Vibrio cholerae]